MYVLNFHYSAKQCPFCTGTTLSNATTVPVRACNERHCTSGTTGQPALPAGYVCRACGEHRENRHKWRSLFDLRNDVSAGSQGSGQESALPNTTMPRILNDEVKR
mmetsp:Transcript_17288/g.32813  ORF Transcript_17288/g.32813 Transcript_17288/m.32813 type:complete len:105 (-) Transcript_17288:1494-1808(-)